MSLLDDVSIVITPNAYNVSTLYAVIPTPILGPELVPDGNFTNQAAVDYWQIASSRATKSLESGFMRLTYDVAIGSALYKNSVATVGKNYLVTFRAKGTANSNFVAIGDNNSLGRNPLNPVLTNDWQDYKFIVPLAIGITFRFYLNSAQIGETLDITNISIKEWTGADMDVTRNTAATRVDENGLVNYAEIIGSEEVTDGNFPLPNTAWTSDASTVFAEGSVTLTGVGTYKNLLVQTNVLESGKLYKVTYTCDLSSVISGSLKLQSFSDGSVSRTVLDGTNTIYLTANATTFYFGEGGMSGTATLSNVSVKEVTRDNVPRIDYTGGGCPHILSEPERINLLRYSEDFSEWSVNGTSAVDGGVSSIGLNYYTITNTGGGFLGVYYGAAGISHGDTITASVYVKKGTSDDFRLRYGASINQNVDFNLDDGTIVSEGTNVVGTIQSMSDGWYRVTSTWTDATHTFNSADIALYTSSGNVEISGAQCEVGSYPTSYIPTDGTTVTRNKDIFTRDGIGSLINDSEGVLFIEMALFSDEDSNKYMSISDGTDDNKIQIDFDYSLSRLQYVVKSGTAVQVNLKLSYTGTNMDKIAFKWKENDFAVWLNGVEIGTDTLGDAPIGLNTLKLSAPAGSNNFEGKVKQLQVYDTALTDEQLLQLTGTSGTDFYESYAEMAAALTYTLQ